MCDCIEATFTINYSPSKLSELENDTGFITEADIDENYATKEDVLHNQQEIEENAENIGTVSNAKLNRDLTDITETGIEKIKMLIMEVLNDEGLI